MSTSLIMSHNYAYVKNPGGVADVADNLSKAFGNNIPAFKEVFPSEKHKKARTLRRFSEEIALEFRHYREDVVLFFPNYFTVPLPGSSTRNVILVHDLQYRAYPQFHSASKRLILESSYRIARRHAAGIIFISRATQSDFIRYFGEPRRHQVILNPVIVDTCAVAPEIARAIGSNPYAIANFHSYPHKNIEGVFSLFSQMRRHIHNLKLVLTGRHVEIDAMTRRHQLPPDSVVRTGFLPKAMVLHLVANAEFFVSLSLFEGFNMAAAEAAKLGRPVLLSDIPVHRELFEDYAYFVDPKLEGFSYEKFHKFLTSFDTTCVWEFAEATEPEAVARKYKTFFEELCADRL